MLLEVKNLEAFYGKRKILYDVSIAIHQAEIVSLIGHNGAGKRTTLRSIFGLVIPLGGKVYYMDRNVTMAGPHKKLEMGIYHMP